MKFVGFSDWMETEKKVNRSDTRAWLECYISQTVPTFEKAKAHFEKKKMAITKADYKYVCEKVCAKPQFES